MKGQKIIRKFVCLEKIVPKAMLVCLNMRIQVKNSEKMNNFSRILVKD